MCYQEWLCWVTPASLLGKGGKHPLHLLQVDLSQQPPCSSCPCMSEGQSCSSPRAWGDSRAMVASSLGRRVASVTQSSQSESPSCSPFGKKKKCKDKYLAKHSSSKCEQGHGLHAQPWPSLLPLCRDGSGLHGTQTKWPSCVGSGTLGGYPTAVSFFESLFQGPHAPQVAAAVSSAAL